MVGKVYCSNWLPMANRGGMEISTAKPQMIALGDWIYWLLRILIFHVFPNPKSIKSSPIFTISAPGGLPTYTKRFHPQPSTAQHKNRWQKSLASVSSLSFLEGRPSMLDSISFWPSCRFFHHWAIQIWRFSTMVVSCSLGDFKYLYINQINGQSMTK